MDEKEAHIHTDGEAEDLTPENAGEGADAAAPKTAEPSSVPPQVSYDDFAKLEIKIGVITAVEVVAGADKLLKLSVDVGEAQPRQIISGIREYFDDPQFLVGKQCPFITNLQPRTIRGYESQGMILAAHANDTFALLMPHNALPAGTQIK